MQRILIAVSTVLFFLGFNADALTSRLYQKAYIMILPHKLSKSTIEFSTQGCESHVKKALDGAWSTVVSVPSYGCHGKIVNKDTSTVIATLVLSSDINATRVTQTGTEYCVNSDTPSDISSAFNEYVMNVGVRSCKPISMGDWAPKQAS